MTMTMDVNQDFADERAGQIAAAAERNAQFDQRVADGKLIALGNGRFRVNEPGSWDRSAATPSDSRSGTPTPGGRSGTPRTR